MYELQTLCSSYRRNVLHVVKLDLEDRRKRPLQSYVSKCSLHFLHIMNLWLYAKSQIEDTRRLFAKELRIEYLVSPDRAIQYPSDAVWDKYLTQILSQEEWAIFPIYREKVFQSAKNAVARRGPARVHPECLLLIHHHHRLQNNAAAAAGGLRAPLENYMGCSKQRACYMCARFFFAYQKAAPQASASVGLETRLSLFRLEGPWAMPDVGDAELESKILDSLYEQLCRGLACCVCSRKMGFGLCKDREEAGETLQPAGKSLRQEAFEESRRQWDFRLQEKHARGWEGDVRDEGGGGDSGDKTSDLSERHPSGSDARKPSCLQKFFLRAHCLASDFGRMYVACP
ncbi:hypothetical protein BOTBODRAFT_580166 [Botryobasidium botryosum FD-172 SS1]|uniref:Uncharacterized protein n=1 Tax=Botryobasidium botryosum (strain FD-172 SS1) TaxID=930990 RepID=A0A067MQ27_BOTB1|nr:hypothetical protein BOTBODRAFT_580166 [Botryobasidium botryosum FD-172 SS1]